MPWFWTSMATELWETHFCVSKLPTQWDFVMATQMDWDNILKWQGIVC
jgi:hypothetical protein